MPKLCLIHRDESRQVYPLHQGVITIGRDPASHIHLDSPAVRPQHARIFTIGDSSVIQALTSQADVFINNEEVLRRELSNEDLIHIGSYKFQFLDPDAPARHATPTDVALAGAADEEERQSALTELPAEQEPVDDEHPAPVVLPDQAGEQPDRSPDVPESAPDTVDDDTEPVPPAPESGAATDVDVDSSDDWHTALAERYRAMSDDLPELDEPGLDPNWHDAISEGVRAALADLDQGYDADDEELAELEEHEALAAASLGLFTPEARPTDHAEPGEVEPATDTAEGAPHSGADLTATEISAPTTPVDALTAAESADEEEQGSTEASSSAGIEILRGPNQGKQVLFDKSRVVLGNLGERIVMIRRDDEHYLVWAAAKAAAATLNGTLLLEEPQPLTDGDEIEFANLSVRFFLRQATDQSVDITAPANSLSA